jgi:hypothetical protein
VRYRSGAGDDTNEERERNEKSRSLIHFGDASGLYHRRLLLTFGKVLGAFSINVHTGKLLAVLVDHGDFPMTMLAPAVPVYVVGLLCLFSLHE